jgi:hypothetical protein
VIALQKSEIASKHIAIAPLQSQCHYLGIGLRNRKTRAKSSGRAEYGPGSAAWPSAARKQAAGSRFYAVPK